MVSFAAQSVTFVLRSLNHALFRWDSGERREQQLHLGLQPANALGEVLFVNGWTQRLAFLDKIGVAVNTFAGLDGTSSPILAPAGTSGTPAFTLVDGAEFLVSTGGTLKLTGGSNGKAVFMAGDGTAGEYLANAGTLIYTGQANANASNVDYLKVPVNNQASGVFKVNGNVSQDLIYGATLQVSGTDPSTGNVSFFQNGSGAETDIYGSGTLWAYNNYTMTAGKLQSTDLKLDTLQVGTAGPSPVDGTVNLVGGTVNFNAGGTLGGSLDIAGTTPANDPILNIGSVTFNFKVDMTADSNASDSLVVGNPGGTGTVNFGFNGGVATVNIIPQGDVTQGHKWPVLYYGSVTGNNNNNVTVPAGYTANWSNPHYLEIDN
jgi:hypothetical protein